ncbi:hypothetical protein CDD82_1567 [Ophiocordyceps australis]|uniref:Protein kinase domain-containing protein n=1 Tax=Ophiocordyceps australis TaxID=1399860 RepID=A0A2C5Y9Z3_9HYPO|nr:hypothetical protein CDD82_1567 [Ophiocordyceps australis]
MLWNQLARSLDDGIKPLNLDGSRGVLFKVTLLAYGYTFVSKATVRAFVDELNHEATVYKRLKKLQGIIVPVFLGSIDLSSMKKIYYYAHRVYLVHMTFLSWGGTDIARTEKTPNMDYASLETKSIQSLEALHQEGVIHTDARLPNMLVNSETNGVMIIDFERSILLEPPRRPLAQLIPRKREWKPDIQGDKEMDGQSRKQKVARRFATEIGEAKCEFLPFK